MGQFNIERAEKLYNAIKGKGYDIGDYNDYINRLSSDKSNAEKLYSALYSAGFDIGSDYMQKLYGNGGELPSPLLQPKPEPPTFQYPYFTPQLQAAQAEKEATAAAKREAEAGLFPITSQALKPLNKFQTNLRDANIQGIIDRSGAKIAELNGYSPDEAVKSLKGKTAEAFNPQVSWQQSQENVHLIQAQKNYEDELYNSALSKIENDKSLVNLTDEELDIYEKVMKQPLMVDEAALEAKRKNELKEYQDRHSRFFAPARNSPEYKKYQEDARTLQDSEYNKSREPDYTKYPELLQIKKERIRRIQSILAEQDAVNSKIADAVRKEETESLGKSGSFLKN
ncbi:MAG: hypothetical protein LBH19_05530, partial [Dysgonamonadaceae bacterium]|nr:hypothetical protein [Dysgonamonadaceae bacterium]